MQRLPEGLERMRNRDRKRTQKEGGESGREEGEVREMHTNTHSGRKREKGKKSNNRETAKEPVTHAS